MNFKRFSAAVVAAAMILSMTGCDSSDYKKANQLMAEGSYEDAKLIFTELGDYKDSSELVSACEYELAWNLYDAGDYEGAKDKFDALGGYKDSADISKSCEYSIAVLLFNNGDYEKARARFAALKDYEDSANNLTACDYEIAKAAMNSGDYEGAKKKFESLGGYSDSADMVNECQYLAAEQLLDDGEYQNARKEFLALGDYKDSDEKADEAMWEHLYEVFPVKSDNELTYSDTIDDVTLESYITTEHGDISVVMVAADGFLGFGARISPDGTAIIVSQYDQSLYRTTISDISSYNENDTISWELASGPEDEVAQLLAEYGIGQILNYTNYIIIEHGPGYNITDLGFESLTVDFN